MKTFKIALTTLIIITITGLLFAATPAILSGDGDKETAVIKVEGMTCSFCAKTVKTAFSKEAGVSSVELDAETGLATITYDKDKTSPELVAQNVTKETYFESKVVKDVQVDKSE